MVYRARSYRENFNDAVNKVDDCVANVWTRFSDVEDDSQVISFQAVYFNASGSLQIRDAYQDVIYSTSISGAMTQPDILVSPLTVRLPLEYYSNVASGSIRIFGEYV
jgi:hypothetical protein